jgi:hypothetical protein
VALIAGETRSTLVSAFAEQCAGFEAGEHVWIDCDGEEVKSLSPEQREIYTMHQVAS